MHSVGPIAADHFENFCRSQSNEFIWWRCGFWLFSWSCFHVLLRRRMEKGKKERSLCRRRVCVGLTLPPGFQLGLYPLQYDEKEAYLARIKGCSRSWGCPRELVILKGLVNFTRTATFKLKFSSPAVRVHFYMERGKRARQRKISANMLSQPAPAMAVVRGGRVPPPFPCSLLLCCARTIIQARPFHSLHLKRHSALDQMLMFYELTLLRENSCHIL